MKKWWSWIARGAVAAGLACASVPVAADQVEIRTLNGTRLMIGELISFDADFFAIKGAVGLVRVPRAIAVCVGDACPGEGETTVAAAPPTDRLTISGMSDGADELLLQLVGGYIQSLGGALGAGVDPDDQTMVFTGTANSGEELIKVSMRRRDSAAAFDDLLSGASQIAITTRRPTDDERFKFAAAGLSDIISGVNETVLALEGARIVTGDGNPLRSVSIDDAAAIFSGLIDNWAALGGPDAPIRIVTPTEQGPTVGVFNDQILRPRNVAFGPATFAADGDGGVVTTVRDDPTAIGIVGLDVRGGGVRQLPIRLNCGLVSDPSTFALKSEEYPLMRRLYVYVRNDNPDLGAAELISYAQSAQGQTRMAEAGYVDQSIELRRMNEFGTRLAASLADARRDDAIALLKVLATELIDADQFSATLRFRAGSAAPDSRATEDIKRLAAIFAAPEYREKEVMLVGFTDSVGLFGTNVTLSERRARQVRDAIIAEAGGALSERDFGILGLGPTAPVGCNDEVAGREINRRVEVWVRNR